MVKLEEVCEVLDSMRVPVTASDRISGIYPYYGANGIQDYVSDYIFDDELVLLAEDGGNFGSKTKPIAYRVSGKCWVNNHAHVLKAKPSINIDYLCYSIMFYDVSKIISGTTRAKLNQAAMRKMIIPLPPLETQKQIAKILDTVSELLAMSKQQLAELDNLIKSIFYDMFGDPVTNEKKWEIKSLNNICTKITDGTHDTPKRVQNGVLFITGKNIRPFSIDLGDIEYVSLEDHQIIYKRCNPQKGDILYTNIGVNYGTAAKCTIDFEFSMKNVALLKIDGKVTESIYLECILNYMRLLHNSKN